MEETVKKMVNNPKFRAALKDKIGANVDASELKSERESYRKSLQQCIGAKNKLAAQIDALDITDKHYDRKYQDMQDRLDLLYDQMGDIEDKIEIVNKRIDNLLKERLSADTIYKVLIQFDKLYDNFTDLEKKKFMQSFIEEVQIYEQPKENGRFLKSISFAFPVYYNDKEFTTIAFGEDALKEYADNLTKENLVGWDKEITDETCVLLSH